MSIRMTAAFISLCSLAGCPQAAETTDTTATDGTTTDQATVTENNAPFANAGDDISAVAGELVTLDGANSSDPDFDRLVFIWRQVAGSPEIELTDAFSSRPKFRVPSNLSGSATLTFRLTVADGFAADFDEVDVVLSPATN